MIINNLIIFVLFPHQLLKYLLPSKRELDQGYIFVNLQFYCLPLISPSGSPSAFHDFYDSFDYDEEDWDVWESEPTDSEVGEEEEVDGHHHEEEKGEQEEEEVMDQSRMEEKQEETQKKDIS